MFKKKFHILYTKKILTNQNQCDRIHFVLKNIMIRDIPERKEKKMKAVMKKISLALVVGVLACVCLVGCGAISIDDVKGDWTLDSIGGQSLADYAAANGVDASTLASNWTIKDDKTLTSTNMTGTSEFTMELKANGFELKQKGQDAIFASVVFDKNAGTLSYEQQDATGKTVKMVFKKGTAEIGAAGGAEATEGGEATTDDASATEETTDDGSAEEATDDTEATEEEAE